MRKTMLLIALIAPAAFFACGTGATNQQAEIPAAQTTTPPPSTPPPAAASQEAAATPQPYTPPASKPATTTHTQSAPPASHSTPVPTATAYRPPEPPKPMMVEVPAGTVLDMEFIDPLSSKTNVAGDTFTARVVDAIDVGGVEVIPAGSIVAGTVTEAVSAKKMSGQAKLTLQFSKLTLPDGHTADISAMLSEKGKNVGHRTGGIVGGSAAGGAVLGKIIGKDTKGAVVGALLGAAIGSGVAASQKGQELKLPAGTGFSVELQSPVQVPVSPQRG